MEVPDSVKQEANRCPNNFTCIATGCCGHQEDCTVHHSAGRNVLSLNSRERWAFSCPYRLSFGYGQICTCPVRYYLYTQYPKSYG